MLRISIPSSVSIAVYALAYLGLLRFVLTPLGDEATAGLGLGFQVFEGIAFPFYLGVSIAGSSLVGREIGARNPAGVMHVVGSARLVARICGIFFAVAFWFLGPRVIEQTVRETLPEGFQRSEFLLEHGAIDMIVDRREMRETIIGLLGMLTGQPAAAP